MLKVVLADDEKKVVLLLQKLIDWQALGYEVVGVANDGVRALELVQEKQPDLLITDIRMPGCDGLELIGRAKACAPKLHFIVISGYRQFEYAQSAIKYGVEDYLLKPLKQEELSDILLRLRDKLGEQAALAYRLKQSDEQQQARCIAALMTAAKRQQPFLEPTQAAAEFGLPFGAGAYLAAVVKPDIPQAEQYLDGYQIMMRHSLEIVRRELASVADGHAAAAQQEGIVVLLYWRERPAASCKQRFTKICNEIEQQRDLFWEIHCTICLGRPCDSLPQASHSLCEALWLCCDRLCRTQPYRDAVSEPPAFDMRYRMDASQKKRLQEAAEYRDAPRFRQALEDSYCALLPRSTLNGQMLADWSDQVREAALYGMQQSGDAPERLAEQLEERFWRCVNAQEVFRMLSDTIGQAIERAQAAHAAQVSRPIAEAKRYIQQHFHQPLRLDEVAGVVGFNATYFSALFKKETGQNFMDHLTALRIDRAKMLLCQEELTVQDVAEQVGYSDLKYFSRLFKKITGVTPSDYKKLYK